MKKVYQREGCNLRLLFVVFILSVAFTSGARAQTNQGFASIRNLVSVQCRDNQLSVRHVAEDAAMGGVRTRHYAFTNTSSQPCTLSGYPRFEVLARSGRLARRGRATNGLTMLGDDAQKPPHLVTIEPGETTQFLVYYNAGGAGRTGRPCPTYRKIRITAPGNRRVFVLREDLTLCGGLEVSPVGLSLGEEH
jgi:hypothetical protein